MLISPVLLNLVEAPLFCQRDINSWYNKQVEKRQDKIYLTSIKDLLFKYKIFYNIANRLEGAKNNTIITIGNYIYIYSFRRSFKLLL